MENPLTYRLLQAPWAHAKVVPFLQQNSIESFSDVLDLGCGPGTNTELFSHCKYLGVDINPKYIQAARHRHKRDFLAADVRTLVLPADRRFDTIFLNSFLHHVADDEAVSILESCRSFLSANGHIHVLDLVLPEKRSVGRALARLDRGHFARSGDRWFELFTHVFEAKAFEPYTLRLGPINLWHMVYFKGCNRV